MLEMDTVNKNGKFPSNYKVSPIDFEKDKPLQTKPCLSRGKRELDVTYMIYDWLPYWKHCPKSSALNSDSLSSDIFELLAEDVGTLQIKRVLFFILDEVMSGWTLYAVLSLWFSVNAKSSFCN